jgi:hypothetical protein
MPNDGRSKCKLCGGTHRLGEPHEFPKSEPVSRPVPKQQAPSVTKPVTPPVTIAQPANVTPPVSANVTPPTNVTPRKLNIPDDKRGHRPKLYDSPAERQRAYRARRSSHDHPQ